MTKEEKEVIGTQLGSEEKTLKELKQIFTKAKKDCQQKIVELNARTDMQNLQSIIYQRKYQEAIDLQISGILTELETHQYKTVEEFLIDSYDNGYAGNMFILQAQGIPVTVPIDERKVVRALTTDSKLSEKYYQANPVKGRLAENTSLLKDRIRSNLSRGIVAGKTWVDTAKDIASGMNNPFDRAFNDAMRIVRTEGHRVNQQGFLDAGNEAKKKGADIVKQWDATLDGRTRPAHMEADGQIRELDEDFIVGGEKLSAPSVGGSAWNVINCRCQLLQRAKWALDEDELKTLQERAEYFGLDKSKSFENFKQKYLKLPTNADNVLIQKTTFIPAKDIKEAEEYAQRFVDPRKSKYTGNVSYKGISIDNANKINETLTEIFDTYDVPLLRNIEPMNFRMNVWKGAEDAPFAYRDAGSGELYFNPRILKNKKAFEAYNKKGKEAFEFCKSNIDKFTGRQRTLVETYIKAGRQLVSDDAEDVMKAMVQHEMGHHIQNQKLWRDKEALSEIKNGLDIYPIKISGYATTTNGEYIAESFCAFNNGESDRIDPFLKKYFEGLIK